VHALDRAAVDPFEAARADPPSPVVQPAELRARSLLQALDAGNHALTSSSSDMFTLTCVFEGCA
jgi:hypothetical protein